jgi:hypothetical protein
VRERADRESVLSWVCGCRKGSDTSEVPASAFPALGAACAVDAMEIQMANGKKEKLGSLKQENGRVTMREPANWSSKKPSVGEVIWKQRSSATIQQACTQETWKRSKFKYQILPKSRAIMNRAGSRHRKERGQIGLRRHLWLGRLGLASRATWRPPCGRELPLLVFEGFCTWQWPG